ncbi:MAG: helicase-exonuclease AddAB subunit AddB [Lachnospiraceae bacterium]|nr:helicase-exonuclease AddAB subunit AddB [Lachnospiraceae bacterium]
MSLRFYFGGSGAGKSTKLYNELIERSMKEPRRNFLIVVPDQFTMQTQKELVLKHERGGIMNIDVLSFGRLSHRIFEEVGGNDAPVLDDTGKSLVLRKVAANLKEELPVLGGNLDKQGYIHEVKSAISEFMQYGIAPDDVEKLIAYADKRGALKAKLQDLEVLYRGFKEYIKDQFITTEETLDLLQKALHRSKIIPGSVVVFDGFTGFTPIQNRVIQELMVLADEVIVTVTVDVSQSKGKEPWKLQGEQELFYLGRKTTRDLCKLAEEVGVQRGEDVYLTGEDGKCRFRENSALGHLEKNLLRYPMKVYERAQSEISIYEASTVREEVHQTAILLEKLVREQGYCYRDIAVVCGDLGAYGEHVEYEFALLGIPCYVDRTRGIVLNPFTEYIRSALRMVEKDFSFESVFQYLRSGMADFTLKEVDLLENFVRKNGIRGRRKWEQPFTCKLTGKEKEPEKELEKIEFLNGLRERLLLQLMPLLQLKRQETVKAYVENLYEFLVEAKVAEKLAAYEKNFEAQGNLTAAKEYGQIYRLVMDLLNQIIGLLGGEKMTMEEFADILDAGFGEIEVGTIPQNVDRVLVGDIERTRLKELKVLFFLGVNDGNIPKAAGKGGIISDIDREFLCGSGQELAPSPRQQMYTQRLYLYLNMTKPSEKLYLSYAKVSGDGKSIRPAYLVDIIKKMYPGLEVLVPESKPWQEQIITPDGGMKYLAAGLRDYVSGYPVEPDLFTLYHVYKREYDEKVVSALVGAAFKKYEESSLGAEVARKLYGKILQSSVSRLETYAACAYSHFLKYGLNLKERREFGFEVTDMGNVFHGVLESFAGKLEESGYTWFNFPEEFGKKTVAESMEMIAAQYGNTVLYSSARNAYAVKRMQRILTRAVLTMQYQIRKGMFVPGSYELSFSKVSDFDSINIALSETEKIRLQGRIDRVDTCVSDDRLYVKVVDYKSGKRQFDLVAVYYGLQLQLVVYMNAAMELEKRKNPDKEIVPAAMLYYQVADPATEIKEPLSEEELNRKLIEDLRTSGVVNDREDVIMKLDGSIETKSDVVPVEYKKDGSLSSRSSTLGTEEMQDLSSYVNYKIRSIGKEILSGNICLNPYENGNRDACAFCDFKGVCGFDISTPGYKKRKLKDYDKEEIMEVIREEVSSHGN